MNTILKASERIFLIDFAFQATNGKHFFQSGADLVKLLKSEVAEKGINTIKEFDPSKETFKKVSKEQFRKYFSWDTETDLFLDTHYYFKKQKS